MDQQERGSPLAVPVKRPRPVISCLECRRKKLKCSRNYPCEQCLKVGRPGRCEFQAGQEPEPNLNYSGLATAPNKRRRFLSPAAVNGDAPAESVDEVARSIPSATAQLGIIEDLQARVARLEKVLISQAAPASPGQPSTTDDHAPEASTRSNGNFGPFPSGGTEKILFPEASSFLARLRDDESLHELRSELTALNYDVELLHHQQSGADTIGRQPSFLNLPPFDMCEKLAVLYFDNLEHCFRILHWPRFKDQLKTLFDHGEQACDFAFYPQLLGVLSSAVALGTHDECAAVKTCVIIRPAETLKYMRGFIDKVTAAQKYTLPVLQVKMLVSTLAWINHEPMDILFHLYAEILMDALIMKMDRDPSVDTSISVFDGELRRRCWMTLLEFNLMLSILGRFPSIVPSYTTSPPLNINDADLLYTADTLPTSRPTTEWTDGLCQYLLAQSFPKRSAACREVDEGTVVQIEKIVAYTRYLEDILQQLPAPLRFNYLGDKASKTPPRLMARMEFDISIRRPLMCLYTKAALAPGTSPYQDEVRAGLLQSCYMILNYQDLFDPKYSELDVPRPQGYWDFFYACYRQELGQGTLGLCLEIQLINRAEGEAAARMDGRSLSTTQGASAKGPCYSGAALTASIADTLEPMTRRLPYRASSVKDVVYYNVVLSSLQPTEPGQSKHFSISQRLKEVVRECRAELAQGHVINQTYEFATVENGAAFDPLWADFPVIDALEPLSFITAA